MHYLIDGNNLLWVMLDQQDRQSGPTIADSVQLAWAISRYLKDTADQADIVFDGPEPEEMSRFQNIPNLTIWFAGPGRQADAWIEQRLRSYRQDKPLVVISSDRRIRQAAVQAGARQMRSEAFWGAIIAHKQQPLEPPAKRDGLSQTETEIWMRIFGLQDGN